MEYRHLFNGFFDESLFPQGSDFEDLAEERAFQKEESSWGFGHDSSCSGGVVEQGELSEGLSGFVGFDEYVLVSDEFVAVIFP